jgi:serine/threonine-protein phosphatase 2A regulatory subunit B
MFTSPHHHPAGSLLTRNNNLTLFSAFSGHGETSWCFSQVKGALNDDITDADVISCVEFNHDGDLLATGDKGGRVVIFQVSSARWSCDARRD